MRTRGLMLTAGTAVALAAAAGLPADSHGRGQRPREGDPAYVTIDRSLAMEPVQLDGFTAAAVRYTDAQRVDRERPLSDLLAIAPAWWTQPGPRPPLASSSPTPPPTIPSAARPADDEPTPPTPNPEPTPARSMGLVELVDGERFPGWPASGTTATAGAKPAAKGGDKGDILLWQHERFGLLRIPLDEVSRLTLASPTDEPSAPAPTEATVLGAPAPERTDDEVVFRNGDRVKGLVEEIGDRIVISAPGATPAKPGAGGGAKTEAPLDRVEQVLLANKRRAPAGEYAWLRGGTVVKVEHLESASAGSDGLIATLGANLGGAPSRGQWAIGDMEALLVDAAAVRPLSELPVKTQEGAPGRRWFERARAVGPDGAALWSRDVQLRGPMTVEWELPKAAAMIGGAIQMPDEALVWGDCQVILAAIGPADKATELAHERLNADHPRAELTARIPPGSSRLRVTVQEGANGPIQDWVDLRRVLIVGK